MKIDVNVLDATERMIYALRTLYMTKGYARYRMSKFEEYDLYSRNKSFLVSDEVITFTDTNGKLMALKPDVTLSIVKNTRDDGETKRLCYNENVYRVSGGVRAFREIMQTGIELIGSVSPREVCEVLTLAAQSLKVLSSDYILELSDLDLLLSLVEGLNLNDDDAGRLLSLVGSKNRHELPAFCEKCGLKMSDMACLEALMGISLPPSKAIETLKILFKGDNERIRTLNRVLQSLVDTELDERVRLDFSLGADTNYYNGIVFKGYVAGVPESVLSGGQYDRLMQKMGRRESAIGFAVYLDRLERLMSLQKEGNAPC